MSPLPFSPIVACLLLVGTGCARHSPDYVSARWKMGQRRGRGVGAAELHRQFLLAHRQVTTPEDPRNAEESVDYLMAESRWFAGDREFAAAVEREPLEVRRSVARCIAIEDLLPDFPRTHALLAPLDPSPNSNCED